MYIIIYYVQVYNIYIVHNQCIILTEHAASTHARHYQRQGHPQLYTHGIEFSSIHGRNCSVLPTCYVHIAAAIGIGGGLEWVRGVGRYGRLGDLHTELL